MLTIPNLKFTKFFDVKSPVGILQKGETLENYSIGVDLYMPKLTQEFADILMKVNEKQYGDGYKIVKRDRKQIIVLDDNKKNLFTIDFGKEIFIHNNLQIPTGVGFLLPQNVWLEVRTKSSNYMNGFTEVHGTVDMNYTYGVGVQIVKFPDWNISFKEDEKFAQVVLHEAVPILKMEEVTQTDWEANKEVKLKRGIRTGGFGSSGKFDK